MKKRIRIVLEEREMVCSDGSESWVTRTYDNDYTTRLYDYEYPNVYVEEYTPEQLDDALNLIVTYFKNNGINGLLINLDERNQSLAPAKKMTLKEIEEELGYKVEIIDDVTEDDIPWLSGEEDE